MHRVASSTRGAVIASVGQACMHRVHVPHRSASNGASTASGKSTNSDARKRNDPARGLISIVFLPNQPSPARCARSRSSTGPEST